MKRCKRTGAAALGMAMLALASACAMTPEEIRGVQAENELLREQIQALRERCQQGRELELRREAPVDEER
jgi:hypothetical protein